MIAIPYPLTAPVALKMFERFSTGLYFDQQITDWLNSQGVLTLRNRPSTKDSVRDMLQNPFYRGYN